MNHRMTDRYRMIARSAAFAAVFFRITAAVLSILVLFMAAFFSFSRLMGMEHYIVKSGSMEPEIPAGSVAFIDTQRQPENVGQIIAYHRGRSSSRAVILHRIVGVQDDGWITKGDSNDRIDAGIVDPQAVVGTYLFSVPRAGAILSVMQGRNLAIMAGVVILLNVLSSISELLV